MCYKILVIGLAQENILTETYAANSQAAHSALSWVLLAQRSSGGAIWGIKFLWFLLEERMFFCLVSPFWLFQPFPFNLLILRTQTFQQLTTHTDFTDLFLLCGWFYVWLDVTAVEVISQDPES